MTNGEVTWNCMFTVASEPTCIEVEFREQDRPDNAIGVRVGGTGTFNI